VWHAVVFVGMLQRRLMPTRGLGRVTACHPWRLPILRVEIHQVDE
jgi:hypothetical protein